MPQILLLFFLLIGVTIETLRAQSISPSPEKSTFYASPPDSSALNATPTGTFLLQGQPQPIRPFLTVQDQLRTVASVQVTPYDGRPGSGNVVRIRGASVAQGLSQPLYIIDGLPALNDDLTPGQALSLMAPESPSTNASGTYVPTITEQNQEAGASPLQLLPPDAIERIEVLTGPAAVARYGPLAANGVISIRTRRSQSGRPLRVQYAAYAGLQQLRQRYKLLDASQYAAVVNEASDQFYGISTPLPFPSTDLGQGTDWQAESYRLAVLQQHQLSLDGGRGGTTYLFSTDYRQQAGILRGSDLRRLGLRLALGQRLGAHLQVRGTAALGQTQQRLPYTQSGISATRAALFAPPNQPVYNAQGGYSGYGPETNRPSAQVNFNNPLAVADFYYREPNTRRLLAQLGATYTPRPGLEVEASANFQRTLLAADSHQPEPQRVPNVYPAPRNDYVYSTQRYRTSNWAGQLAVRYERPVGQRQRVGVEVDYQYQAVDYYSGTDTRYAALPNTYGGYSYFQTTGALRLHRPWARLHYTLDSTLTLETSLSYAHFRGADNSYFYPSTQLSWHTPAAARLAARLWVGTARTSTYGTGSELFYPPLARTGFFPTTSPGLGQELRANQLEAGVRLASRRGHLTGQVVAYQRRSSHTTISELSVLPNLTGYTTYVYFTEASIRNQGLELTLTADWQLGRLEGSTRLVGSLNRNRLQQENAGNSSGGRYDNQPTGSFYGFLQDGLKADGSRRFAGTANGGSTYTQAILGTGIPPQLASLSQQLRLGRLALDAQLDGLFDYQMLNYQLAYLDTPTGYANSAPTVLYRWTPFRPVTNIPVAGSPANPLNISGPTPPIDYLLEDAANVRLSSLTLAYRLRQTATPDLRVWAGVQNLFVLTRYRGYDPNVSSGGATADAAGLDYGAVPVPRTWLLGVQAAF